MRKYLPTLSELIDRLSITQLKEIRIPEHKKEYVEEIKSICHDIDLILSEGNIILDATTIRAIIILAQYNLNIWNNEANYRKGIKDGNNLELSHAMNGVRNRAKNLIENIVKENSRKDYKVDCIAADHCHLEPTWNID